MLLTAVLPPPMTSAYQRPGTTERVSVSSSGDEADGGSTVPAISADGRYVAFYSVAKNLVPGDTNNTADIFVRDRTTGTIERVSVSSSGVAGEGSSAAPAISADGRFVAFRSVASNLVAGDGNERADIFVHDRATGTTERVSVSSSVAEANDMSTDPAISADGRFVAFQSTASNLVPDDTNERADIFVHDRATGTTERVSVSSDGDEAEASSSQPALSDDGMIVVFRSPALNLAPGGREGRSDIFAHDRAARTTERVSVSSAGDEANQASDSPAISGDGRFVAFRSIARTMVPRIRNSGSDIYVRDLQARTTERVSVSSAGEEADGSSFAPAVSGDGRFVAFRSDASNLVVGDANGISDVFVHDRATRSIGRVSVGETGAEANGSSDLPAVSADGRFVALRSDATNLVVGDTNGVSDVFVHDRGALLGVVGELAVRPLEDGFGVEGTAAVSGVTVSSADDPGDDSADVGPVAAEDLGGELTGASLVHRPEDEDLLVRLDLASFPDAVGCLPFLSSGGDPTVCAVRRGAAPGIVYGLELEAAGTRYEVRIQGLSEDVCVPLDIGVCAIPGEGQAVLYQCHDTCIEQAPLVAALGTTGDEILVSLPLVGIAAGPQTSLTGLRAFAESGDREYGAAFLLDEVELSDAVIPPVGAELGIAPASVPEDQVGYSVSVPVVRGEFSAMVDTGSLASGSYRVWVRICLADGCGHGVQREVAL